MLPEVYESAPVYYEDATDDVSSTLYNEWLVEPPRLYLESLNPAQPFFGCFARPENTRYGEVAYHLIVGMLHYYHPGYALYVQKFDGRSGDYISSVDKTYAFSSGGIAYTSQGVAQGRGGELWNLEYGLDAYLLDPKTYHWTQNPSETYDLWTGFESPISAPLAIDRTEDRIISRGDATLRVHSLSTGALVATIPLPTTPEAVFLEDERRAYAVMPDGLLVLVDYVELRVLGVYRVIDQATFGVSPTVWAWDPFMRRIIVAIYSEDTETGASTVRMRGYYPTPIAVALTPPIPLQVPRVGRTIRLASRVYGDAGEGISGAEVVLDTDAATVEISALKRPTDRRGYAEFSVKCLSAGTADIDLSVVT